MELLTDIMGRRVDKPRRKVPAEYPHGENGLANVLADIEQELFPLGVDDYGEGLVWTLPGCGVRVVVSRETRRPGPWLIVERLPTDGQNAEPAAAADRGRSQAFRSVKSARGPGC